MPYLGTYWQVYEMMVDGVCGENVKLWLPFLLRLAETRKTAPTARDLTSANPPPTAVDGGWLSTFLILTGLGNFIQKMNLTWCYLEVLSTTYIVRFERAIPYSH